MSTPYPFSDADVQRALDHLIQNRFQNHLTEGAPQITADHDADGKPDPKILIVAGAQGSGKTYLLEHKLLPSERYDNYIRLYHPSFRTLHPHYALMAPKGVLYAYEQTEAFIWKLGTKILEHAMAGQFNIIMESALDSPGFAKFPAIAVAAGYRFEVHLIACQKEFSHWSTLKRGVKSVKDGDIERFVSLVQIEKAQGNARAILDAFENACTEVEGSQITLYQRGFETDMESQPLCHSTCDIVTELVPQEDHNGQPFVVAPHLNPKFEIRRNPVQNAPCSYVQYSQVVHAGITDELMRQRMVSACCQTLDKAQALQPNIPADIFRELSLYVLKYAHP